MNNTGNSSFDIFPACSCDQSSFNIQAIPIIALSILSFRRMCYCYGLCMCRLSYTTHLISETGKKKMANIRLFVKNCCLPQLSLYSRKTSFTCLNKRFRQSAENRNLHKDNYPGGSSSNNPGGSGDVEKENFLEKRIIRLGAQREVTKGDDLGFITYMPQIAFALARGGLKVEICLAEPDKTIHFNYPWATSFLYSTGEIKTKA